MENSWKTITGNLYKGVQIQIYCNIAVAVFAVIAFFATIGDLAKGDIFGAVTWGFWDYMDFFASIGAIYGFWIFFSNIKPWQAICAEGDAKTIGSIYTATILQMIGILLGFIPFIGIIGAILNIVAWVMLLMAYSNLKNSSTFPTKAKEGSEKIYTAMILSLAGAIIGWIPFIGFIGGILSICALVMTIKGWKLIAEAEVE